MSNRRTKKQKVATSQRREQVTYSLKAVTESQVVSGITAPVPAVVNEVDLYDYDVNLIKRDLIRTAVNSGIILALLGGIYFWL